LPAKQSGDSIIGFHPFSDEPPLIRAARIYRLDCCRGKEFANRLVADEYEVFFGWLILSSYRCASPGRSLSSALPNRGRWDQEIGGKDLGRALPAAAGRVGVGLPLPL
jgi:hypothetical protein